MKLFAIILDTLRSRLTTIIVFLSISTFFLLIGGIVAIFVTPSKMVVSATSTSQTQSQTPPSQAPQGSQQNGPADQQDSTDPAQTQGAPSQGTGVPQSRQLQIDLSSVPRLIDFFLAGLAGFVHFAALLLAVFATAGIVPNTLEKGTIDLFLSKPVSRAELLTGRYLGAGLLVFLNTAYFVVGAWLIVSLKAGYWNTPFLAVILTVTASYLILAAAMMALGIATRSSAATIIIVFFFIYLLAPILQAREGFLFRLIDSAVIRDTISTFYWVLPKPGEFTDFATKLIMRTELSWAPIWSSALFGCALFGLSLALLRKKDF